MNFEQWQIEIRNNLQMIQDEANRLKQKPAEISKPQIDHVFAMVKALENMYHNIKEVKG